MIVWTLLNQHHTSPSGLNVFDNSPYSIIEHGNRSFCLLVFAVAMVDSHLLLNSLVSKFGVRVLSVHFGTSMGISLSDHVS